MVLDYTKYVPSFLLNSHTYYVCITDLEGKYAFVNNFFAKRFSFIATNFIGLPFQGTIHKEDILKCNEAARQCIQEPNKITKVLVRKPTPNGDFCWTDWEFSLLQDENMQPIGIFCIGNDVTMEKVFYEYLQHILWKESHVLRKPVANILGLVDLIEEEGVDNLKIKYLKECAKELDKSFYEILTELKSKGFDNK
ncbi:MAG: PAS domain-containing protein [Raineya sp.]|nr:PAS domain-containing protein [Raineya sp.]